MTEAEEFKAKIGKILWQRMKLQGEVKHNGKLTNKGEVLALEFLVGVYAAMQATGHVHEQAASVWVFLASVRGIADQFPQEES